MLTAAFRILGSVLVIVIAILQFTKIFDSVAGKIAVLVLASIAAASVVVSEVLVYRSEKRRKTEQHERDKQIAKLAVEEYRNATTSALPEQEEPKELGMSADDPRIYVSIETPKDKLFQRTSFILNNQGKDVAHEVQIHTFKLDHRAVTFDPVEAIPPGENGETLPTIEGVDGTMYEHNIFHWLSKDWDAHGELIEEWPIPVELTYTDFSKKKLFSVKMVLVFHAIRYLLKERHKEAPSPLDRPFWEMRDIEFKRTA